MNRKRYGFTTNIDGRRTMRVLYWVVLIHKNNNNDTRVVLIINLYIYSEAPTYNYAILIILFRGVMIHLCYDRITRYI